MEWMTPVNWHPVKLEPLPRKFHGLAVVVEADGKKTPLNATVRLVEYDGTSEYTKGTVVAHAWNEGAGRYMPTPVSVDQILAWAEMPGATDGYLTDRELNMVLACIRNCQHENVDLSGMEHFDDIPEGPLSWDEVDELIESKLYGLS